MDKEIIERLQRVNLTVDEDESTQLDKDDVCKEVEDYSSSCIWRLYLDKDFPIRVLPRMMRKVCRLEKLRVAKIRTNVVQVFFPDGEVMDKILKGGHMF